MKKLLLFFILLLFGVSCWNPTSQKADKPRYVVLSTIAMIDDLVREIGKKQIVAKLLIEGEIDPHSYEMVKGDNEKLGSSDLIFYNGLGLEHGATLSYYLQNCPRAYSLGDYVAKNHPEKLLQRDQVFDPHIWMDISIWEKTIPFIVEKLSELAPEHKELFQKRGEILREKFLQEHQKIRDLLLQIPSDKRFLVTSHDAFHYFAKSYLSEETENFIRVAAPEGLAPDGAISPMDIKNIIDFLKQKKVSVVFSESNVSKNALYKIVSDSKALGFSVKIAGRPLYGDAMPPKKSGEIGYIAMHRHNAETIYEHLCP